MAETLILHCFEILYITVFLLYETSEKRKKSDHFFLSQAFPVLHVCYIEHMSML